MCTEHKDCCNCDQISESACNDCRDARYFVCRECGCDYNDCEC